MLIKPPRSKADKDGTKFGALPIYLPFDPADVANAVHWIQRLELRFPYHGNHRRFRLRSACRWLPAGHNSGPGALERTDSTSTRNSPWLPLIDDFVIFAPFSTASGHFQRAGRISDLGA
jgi:hypothetical protein